MGHLCGTCQTFGHGRAECADVQKKYDLIEYHKDEMPMNERCTRPDCLTRQFHNNQSHHCVICKLKHEFNDCSAKN
jgi:hypothetical protein